MEWSGILPMLGPNSDEIEEGYAIIRANDQKLNKTDDIFNNSKLHVSSAFIWHDVCLQSEIDKPRVGVIP